MIGREQLYRDIADAMRRGDRATVDRLRRDVEADFLARAKEGDVETARLLYAQGVNIDVALCKFESTAATFPPPPRQVRRTGRPDYEIPFKLISLLLLTIGLYVAVWLTGFLLTHAFGEYVDARVVTLDRVKVKSSFDYRLSYSFAADAEIIEGSDEITQKSWEKLKVGDPVPVKSLKLFGNRLHQLSISARDSTQPGPFIGVVMLGIFTSVLGYLGWFRPMQYARLIRHGAVVPGFVVEAMTSTKNNERIVTYSYHPPQADRYRGKTAGPVRRRPVAGDAVNVFYDPQRPWRSVAYEASGFEII